MSDRERRTITKTVPATEARIHFGEMLKRVYNRGEHLIIEKDGLPVAALLSHAEYEQLRRSAALRELEELNRAANREAQAQGLTEEQAFADLKQIKKEVYAEKYGRPASSRRSKAA